MDGEDPSQYRDGQREEERYRSVVGYPAEDRREYDLSAWGCGGVADSGGDPAFPGRVPVACG